MTFRMLSKISFRNPTLRMRLDPVSQVSQLSIPADFSFFSESYDFPNAIRNRIWYAQYFQLISIVFKPNSPKAEIIENFYFPLHLLLFHVKHY